MPNSYTVIKNNALDTVLYHDNDSIVMQNSYGKELTIAQDVNEDFSVSQTPKGNHLIFYRENNGVAYLSKLTSSGAENSKRLMPCDAFTKSLNCVYGQSDTLGSCFFYTIPSSKTNIYNLYATNFSSDDAVKIEHLVPMKEKFFYFVSSNTPIVIYKNQQNMLILCIFNGQKIHEFEKYVLSRRAESIYDISCLQKDDKIHICYITEQMGKRYLIYKNIHKDSLGENQNLNCQYNLTHCTMFISKDTLFAFSVSKETSYCAFSKDLGDTFSDSTIYFKHATSKEKAHFIPQIGSELCAQEVFMDKTSPLIIDNFYPLTKINKPSYDDDLKKLKSKLTDYEKELKQKDLKMVQMSKTVSASQPQNSMFMQQLNQKYEEINYERNRLLQSVAKLRAENEHLRSQLNANNDTIQTPTNGPVNDQAKEAVEGMAKETVKDNE